MSEFDLVFRAEPQVARALISWRDRTGGHDRPVTIRRARSEFTHPVPRVRGRRWFAWVAALVALLHVGCSLLRRDLPPLRESFPSDGETGFPISGWIILDFSETVYES